jgi:hypothetical protein
MEVRRKHGWSFWFAVGVILLPVLYVGSFGPAAWIAIRTSDRTAKTIMALYAPLGFAAQAIPPFESFLTWYANLLPVIAPATTPASAP